MIGFITDPNVGGTFLSWTMYFLSGRNDYFSIHYNKLMPLTSSPLTKKNAHNFLVNQAKTADDLIKLLPLPRACNDNESVYMHQYVTDTQIAVDAVCNNSKKIVVVALGQDQTLYNHTYYSRNNGSFSLKDPEKFLTNYDDLFEDQVNYYFKDSKIEWDNLNLHNIWDKREFLALNYNPFDRGDAIVNYIKPEVPHYLIFTNDLWFKFDYAVEEMFDFLELKIVKERYKQWLPIYEQWKTFHYSRVRFTWYFDNIIKNILNGVDSDLTRFNLDIKQESAIQHTLIYKHNLNFKTWQLTKFINTKQLHDLLEPNFHDLTKSCINKHRPTP